MIGCSRAIILPAGNSSPALAGIELQRPLEERRGDEQCADAEYEEEEQIKLDGLEAAVFEENGFEGVDAIGEGVNDR